VEKIRTFVLKVLLSWKKSREIVFRADDTLALRRLTRQGDPGAYIRMLQRAHAFSHAINAQTFDNMRALFVKSNAFKRHDEALLRVPGE
jgi:hypothetical protein